MSTFELLLGRFTFLPPRPCCGDGRLVRNPTSLFIFLPAKVNTVDWRNEPIYTHNSYVECAVWMLMKQDGWPCRVKSDVVVKVRGDEKKPVKESKKGTAQDMQSNGRTIQARNHCGDIS
jgi:hypothetical protein